MDASRFDAIVREWRRRPSRRRAVALLLAALPAFAGGEAVETAAAECRYPGMRCRNDLACCRGSICDGGVCRCKPDRIQCGDFCVSRQMANNRQCCKPYKSPCIYGDPIPCCGRSICTGRLDDQWVCCGLEFHPCTQETAGYCCSKVCTKAGRCAPVPPSSARG